MQKCQSGDAARLSKNCKYYNVEFLRIVFSIGIVCFHLFTNMIKYVGEDPLLLHLADKTKHAGMIVECFLIIAGFFLFYSLKNKPEQSWLEFSLNKIARLWPVFAFSIFCFVILSFIGFIKINFYTQFVNLFFLQCIGVTLEYKGINWYISPFFWTMILYFGILKSFKIGKANLIIAILTYFSFVGLINNFSGGFGRETFNIFFNAGLMRCLASIGIGYFVGCLHDRVKNCPEVFINRIEKCVKFVINYQNKLIYVIVFAILFFLFILKQGLVSNITNLKIFEKAGCYAYSIYVMQQVSFYIMGGTLWKFADFSDHKILVILISLIFSVVIAIFTYHFIELPVGRYLKNKFSLIFGFSK
ncbi:acyltransferase [bacterium]|nr:acyltransferase [bacterium]